MPRQARAAPAPPPATPFEAQVRAIVAAHADVDGALLPVLHAVQAAFGHVPAEAEPIIAHALNISRAEVHGVVSFYHDFRPVPAGRRVVKICRAEACQAMGGAALAEAALARRGIGWNETTPDGALTVEPVYCLGLCACGPAAQVGTRVVGRLDAARLDAMLGEPAP